MRQEVIHGDCLEVMLSIADKSIDMILCDLPYGTTVCSWDIVIPFEPLWKQYKRIIKDNGVIVLTASQPFTSALVMSNIKMFKYEWIWDKITGTDSFNAKRRPLKSHENILVFGSNKILYIPQMTLSEVKNRRDRQKHYFKGASGGVYGVLKPFVTSKDENLRYPLSVFRYSNQNAEVHKTKRRHPTQKPVALFEYLIKTYTNEGDLVLDNCAGSGTTGVACTNLKRDFILIEKDKTYFELIKDRLYKMRPEVILQMETDEAINTYDAGAALNSSDFDDLLL